MLEWSTKQRPPENGSITNQVLRIDMRLREKWAKLFRKNKPEGETFSRCIRDRIPTADVLWSANSRDMPARREARARETAVEMLKRSTARRVDARTVNPKRGRERFRRQGRHACQAGLKKPDADHAGLPGKGQEREERQDGKLQGL